MTPIYIRNDNLKKIWELLDVWVEFGFGTVCNIYMQTDRKVLFKWRGSTHPS